MCQSANIVLFCKSQRLHCILVPFDSSYARLYVKQKYCGRKTTELVQFALEAKRSRLSILISYILVNQHSLSILLAL